MNKPTEAREIFVNGFSCCQSVLAAFGPDLGLDRDTCLRIGSGFVAGMGYKGRTCGAVNGAVMAIGLRYGQTDPDDEMAKQEVVRAVNEFVRRFEKIHGTTTCAKLTGYNITDENELEAAHQAQVFDKLCPEFVASAGRILEEVLKQKGTP